MNRTLVRWGLWALPVGGVLTFLPWLGLFFGGNTSPTGDPTAFARSVTDPVGLVFGDLYIIGTLCILFGVLALAAAIAGTPGESWATVGAVAGAIAMVFVVGVWMLLTIGDAVVGDVVLGGHKDAGQVFQWMSGGHWNGRIIPALVATGATGLVGTVGLAVGIWRSGRYPKWLAILFGLAFLLEVASSPPTILGALLLAIAGFLIAQRGESPTPARAPAIA
jgi:hypothetical protein